MPITVAPTSKTNNFAFQLTGVISKTDVDMMAQFMNDKFASHDTVNMLLEFALDVDIEPSASFSIEAVEAQLKSLLKVYKYYVVGAPGPAAALIDIMDKVIPVDAQTYDAKDAAQAWIDLGEAGPPAA